MRKTNTESRSFQAIGQRLKAIRDTTGLSQKDFAARAGIAENTYNQYERGVSQPKIENAYALCDVYGLTLDWIYNGDPSGLPQRLAGQLFKEKV